MTVADIRCGKDNQNKVNVCHKPNGNGNGVNGTNGGPIALCVAASAVPAHLAHGDCLGECGTTLVTGRAASLTGPSLTELTPADPTYIPIQAGDKYR